MNRPDLSPVPGVSKPQTCHRCKKPFSADDVRPIGRGFKILAALAFAAVHSGAFLMEEWSQNYCRSCRRRLSAVSLAVASLALILAATALRWAAEQGYLSLALGFWSRFLPH